MHCSPRIWRRWHCHCLATRPAMHSYPWWDMHECLIVYITHCHLLETEFMFVFCFTQSPPNSSMTSGLFTIVCSCEANLCLAWSSQYSCILLTSLASRRYQLRRTRNCELTPFGRYNGRNDWRKTAPLGIQGEGLHQHEISQTSHCLGAPCACYLVTMDWLTAARRGGSRAPSWLLASQFGIAYYLLISTCLSHC